jgi:hypothetical protein
MIGKCQDMLTKLQEGQVRQDERMTHTDERVASLEEGRIQNASDISLLKGRVDAIENIHISKNQ